MSAPGLKLRAADAADLEILSACLQDALLPVADLHFDAGAGEFLAVANRFRWEAPDARERVHMALRIRHVTGVQRKGFDLTERGRFLSALTLTHTPGGPLVLLCAGQPEAAIRFTISSLDILAEDFGDPWPCASVPTHADSGKGAV